MKKVVAYVRVSSQSQIENTSIETQIEKIELHCKLHDIVIDTDRKYINRNSN